MKKKFNVDVYYTGFCTYQIEAESEEEAILKAREEAIDIDEISSTLENWEEADVAEATR